MNRFSGSIRLFVIGSAMALAACGQTGTGGEKQANITLDNSGGGGGGPQALSIQAPGPRVIEATGRPMVVNDIGTPVVSGGTGAVTVSNNAPLSATMPGAYEFPVSPQPFRVTWTAVDQSSPPVTVTATQMVTVRDTTAPVITFSPAPPNGIITMGVPDNTPDTALTPVTVPAVTYEDRGPNGVGTVDTLAMLTITQAVVDITDPMNPVPATLQQATDQNGAPIANTFLFPLNRLFRFDYTATDTSGNSNTASFRVSVSKGLTILPPDLSQTPFTATGVLTPLTDQQLGLGQETVVGGVAPYTIVITKPAGGFPLGSSVATWTVTDSNNTSASAQQTVIVVDNAPPVVRAPGNIVRGAVDANTPVAVNIGTATVTDNVDQNLTATPTFMQNGQVVTPPVQNGLYQLLVGTYIVNWRATDSSGNTSLDTAESTQRVTILPPTVACDSLKPEFQTDVWPILNQSCIGCHSQASNRILKLAPDTQADYVDVNFEAYRAYSLDSRIVVVNGLREIVARPTNVTPNISHPVRPIVQGSNEYNLMVSMADRAASCTTGTVDASGVNIGLPYQRLRKVTLALAGRLPTAAEENQVNTAANDTEFEQRLDAIMNAIMGDASQNLPGEDAFYERLMEMFNDSLLTDMYLQPQNTQNLAEELRDNDDFTGIQDRYDNWSNQAQDYANYGLTRSPLQLIATIVREDQPFTNILTADYMMVNPYSAAMYGATGGPVYDGGDVANFDRDNWWKATTIIDQDNGAHAHAGVLSTFAYLNRYPSTRTNRNRKRMNHTWRIFMDTIIEDLASRDGLDLSNVLYDIPTYDNNLPSTDPNRNGDPQCTQCHNTLDPVAGAFKNWGNNGRWLGDYDNWYGGQPSDDPTKYAGGCPTNRRFDQLEDLAPGFGAKEIARDAPTAPQPDLLPASRCGTALRWLGERMGADPRFAAAVVKLMFKTLTGQTLLGGKPGDVNDNSFYDYLVTEFTSPPTRTVGPAQYNLKQLIKAVVTSRYFRATNLADPQNASLFPDLGMARLVIPEQLHRKITAVMGGGYVWVGPGTNDDLLNISTYRLLYGGIDSENVITRSTEVNRIMVGIQDRIAFQASCQRVTAALAGADPELFPNARLSDTPDTPQGRQNIRDNIRYLHKRILGEILQEGDIELDETYNLFVAVRNQYSTPPAIPNECRGGTGMATDTNITVTPWMAVVSYLLSDYGFVYE